MALVMTTAKSLTYRWKALASRSRLQPWIQVESTCPDTALLTSDDFARSHYTTVPAASDPIKKALTVRPSQFIPLSISSSSYNPHFSTRMSLIRSFALAAAISGVFAVPATHVNFAGNCQPLESGNGPVSSPDTAEAFLTLNSFGNTAKSAATPPGYAKVFTDQPYTFNAAAKFIDYILLDEYDVSKCKCPVSECNLSVTPLY